MDNTNTIYNEVSMIPVSDQNLKRSKISYIVIGKPGSGKSTLAKDIFETTNLALINEDVVLKNLEETLEKSLFEGQSISFDYLSKCQKDRNDSGNGYILDVFSLFPQKKDLIIWLEDLLLSEDVILVDVVYPDSVLIQKQCANWIDPTTNFFHSGDNVFRYLENQNNSKEDNPSSKEEAKFNQTVYERQVYVFIKVAKKT